MAGFHRWSLEKLVSWEVVFAHLLIVSLLSGKVKACVILLNYQAGAGDGQASCGAPLAQVVCAERGDTPQTVCRHLTHRPLWAGYRCGVSSVRTRAPSAPLAVLKGSVGPYIQILCDTFLSSCRVTAFSSQILKQLKEGLWTPGPSMENGLRDFGVFDSPAAWWVSYWS